MKIFIIFFIVLYQTKAIEIDCHFDPNTACDQCPGLYFCKALNSPLITSQQSRTITGVKGQHLSGKSNDDVTGFETYGKVVEFFPRGLTRHFSKIEYVHLMFAHLQEISKDDLREFGSNLKFLSLHFNDLQSIDADLFEYNKNLIYVDLSHNQIKFIGDGFLSELNNVKTLWMNNNPCTTGTDATQNNRAQVLVIAQRVQQMCKDLKTLAIKNPTEYLRLKLAAIEEQILKLNGEVSSLDYKIKQSLATKFADQENNLKTKLSVLENNLASKLKDVNSKIQSAEDNIKSNLASKLNEQENNFSTRLILQESAFKTILASKLAELEKDLKKTCSAKVYEIYQKFNDNIEEYLMSKIMKQSNEMKIEIKKSFKEKCDFMSLNDKLQILSSELGSKFENVCKKEEPESSA